MLSADPKTASHPDFLRNLVLAGGGCRCVWQLGFLETVLPELPDPVQTVSAVSAGSLMALAAFAGKTREALAYFTEVAAKTQKNAYPEHLFTDRPVFPQYAIYQKAIFDLFDEKSLAALTDGPDIRILLSRPPLWLGPRSATLIGIGAYQLEKSLVYPMHPRLARAIGFRPEVVSLSACTTVKEMAELVLQSSCTPPFIPILKRNHRPVLDGGLVDNVPVSALNPDDPALILLTRPYPARVIPDTANRFYLQPTTAPTVARWDYTDPEGLRRTFREGCHDGEKFLSRYLCAKAVA